MNIKKTLFCIIIIICPFIINSQNDLKDTDNDGIIDHIDNCPLEFGTMNNNGCPDLEKLKHIDRKKLADWEFMNYESNGREGFLDLELNVVIPFKYEIVHNFKNGIAEAKLNGRWGFIDKEDNVIIDFIFDQISDLSYDKTDQSFRNFFKVKINKKEGIYSISNKKFIIHPIYDYIHEGNSLNENYVVIIDKKYGLVDKNGVLIIPFSYDYLGHVDGKSFKAEKFGKWGIIDLENRTVIPFIYESLSVSRISDNMIFVQKGEHFGAINKYNQTVIPFVYRDVELLSNGCFFVTNDKIIFERNKKYLNYSIINNKGQIINKSPILKEIFGEQIGGNAFVDEKTGYIEYTSDGKKYVIDSLGNHIVDPKYDFKSNKGLNFIVSDGSKFGIVNNKRKILTPLIYDNLEFLIDDLLSFKTGSKYGLMSIRNKITEPIYDAIQLIDKEKKYIAVKINGNWGLLASDGKQLLKPIYLKILKHKTESIIFLRRGSKIQILDMNLKCIKNCQD